MLDKPRRRNIMQSFLRAAFDGRTLRFTTALGPKAETPACSCRAQRTYHTPFSLSGEDMDAKTALKYATDQGAKFVSVRFTDLPGAWHHLTFPIDQLTEGCFEDGFGFDASSLRGWAAINESDMLLVPDPSRFWVDPFAEETTICLIANVVDPITKEGYGLDPRSVAVRAESYLKFTGLADTVYFGPEAELFVFDEVNYHNNQNAAGFSVNS